MKPIHLNLAARPYRDERPFIAVVVVGSLLIAFLTLTNFDTWYRYRDTTRNTRANIAALEDQTRQEQQRTQALNQWLRNVDVKRLALQTQVANRMLAERAFSWSDLLDHLERVLPDYVRIENISPSFKPDGMIGLTMQCTARDPDGLARTLNQLNADPQFSNPFPNGEDHTDQGYRFTIHVDYRPTTTRPVS